MPAVVGEIVAGVVIGPSILGFVGSNETLSVLGELGVILLLLGVGMEMDIADLGAVGRSAMSVACVGVVVPMVGGLRGGFRTRSQRQSVVVHRRHAGGDERRDHRPRVQRPARAGDGRSPHRARRGSRRRRARPRDPHRGRAARLRGLRSVVDVALILLVAIGFLVVANASSARARPGAVPVPRSSRALGRNAGRARTRVHARLRRARRRRAAGADRRCVRGRLGAVGQLRVGADPARAAPSVTCSSRCSSSRSASARGSRPSSKPEVLGIAGALLVVASSASWWPRSARGARRGDKLLIGLGMIPRARSA